MTGYSIDEIIEMAILIERSGYSFYENALKKKHLNVKLRELLSKLRDQEKEHELFFSEMHKSENIQLVDYTPDQDIIDDYLRAIINYRIFSSPEAAIKKIEMVNDEEELLETAMDFEKDTLLFFQGIREVIKDSHAKEILEKIIKEEITHILWISLHREKITP